MSQAAPKLFSRPANAEMAKKLEQALLSCRTTMRQNPRDAACLYAMGLIECQLGRADMGAKWLKRALDLQRDSLDIRYHYGLVMMEQAKYAEAIDLFRDLTVRNPHFIDAWYHLGFALREQGDASASEQAYRQVIDLKPDHAGALNNLGNIVSRKGETGEAIGYYQRAIQAKPDYAIAFNNLGLALASIGALADAQAHYRRAIALQPTYPEAHNNLGIVLRLQGQLDEAIEFYRKAIALRPTYAEALNNLGNATKDLGHPDEAVTLYRQALALQPSADYRHNMALGLLALGEYEEGWREYETRWEGIQLRSVRRDFVQALWQGEAAEGRTLLIHAEQGFGDTLQFCRYVPMAAALGFKVIFEVQPALKGLMQIFAPLAHVIGRGETLPDFDMHCPTLSLPRAFGTKVETIPASSSYLTVDPTIAAKWRADLPVSAGTVLRVGLVWAGNPRVYAQDLAAVDRRRSMNPENLRMLINVSGVQFYSLQKSPPEAPEDFNLMDFMPVCHDFTDTAGLIANLDLVISVDTSVAHLAAAMGKPVWLMNRFDSCWRWFQDRSDSPWYPSLRLFRQPTSGDWNSVVMQIRSELEQMVSQAGKADY